MLIPGYPITPSSPDLISLRWSNVSPFLQAQSHQHTLSSPCMTHLPGQLWAVCLQPCPLPTPGLDGISLYSIQRVM